MFGILYGIHLKLKENNEDVNNIFWYDSGSLHIFADVSHSNSEIFQNFSTVTFAAKNRFSGDYSWPYYLEKLKLWNVTGDS